MKSEDEIKTEIERLKESIAEHNNEPCENDSLILAIWAGKIQALEWVLKSN